MFYDRVCPPKGKVNRLPTLARGSPLPQPNMSLDRALVKRILLPVQNGNGGLARVAKCKRTQPYQVRPKLIILRGGVSGSGCYKAPNTQRQARHFTRDGVLMQHTFGDAARQFWLGQLQRSRRGNLVASSKCFFYFAQEGADPRTARLVDVCTCLGLAGAFLGLGAIGH